METNLTEDFIFKSHVVEHQHAIFWYYYPKIQKLSMGLDRSDRVGSMLFSHLV